MDSETSLVLKYPARFVIHLHSFVLIYGKASYSTIKVVLSWMKVTFGVRRILVTLHRTLFKFSIIQLNWIFENTCSAIKKLGIISLTYIKRTHVIGGFFLCAKRMLIFHFIYDDTFSLLSSLNNLNR